MEAKVQPIAADAVHGTPGYGEMALCWGHQVLLTGLALVTLALIWEIM